MRLSAALPVAFAAASLSVLAGCAGFQRGAGGAREVTVEAEGWAPMQGENLLSAKHRALAEAQKRAVEKAVGLTVRARTRVEDAINVQESIEANLGGTIRRYEPLSEKIEDGFYKARIRAVVLYRPQDGQRRMKATTISVRLPNETVARAIRTTLAAHDLPLADSDQGADVVITGVVETFGRADLRLGGFYSYRAQVALSLLDSRTGKVTEQEFEGSALDVDEHSACDAALEQAGEISGERVAQALEPAAGAEAAR